MVIDFIKGELTGEIWEEKCHSCYRMRYQNEHYEEIPAIYKGDAGIEEFTRSGIVIQCYCPEKEYTDNELYEHQRDKMTHDINKLLNLEYKKRLIKMGVPLIREWHFVIPFYKDNRIIEHSNTQRLKVLDAKKKNPVDYDYIDDDFDIVLKVADDFKFEFSRLFRNSINDEKMNLQLKKINSINWNLCDSEKVDNIKRKVKAVMFDIDNDDELNAIVDMYIEYYINGVEMLNLLREDFPDIYEDVFSLEQAYKKQVKLRTMMSTDKTSNVDIINQVIDDFQTKLKSTCGYFDEVSILDLSLSMISMWLADCSLYFRK